MAKVNRFARFQPQLLALEAREVPAVTAVFNTSVLTIIGDSNANAITVSADTNGNLVVTNNGAAVAIQVTVGTATKTSLTTVNVDAKGGDDTIILDRSLNVLDANGKLAAAPAGTLAGGSGADTIRAFTGGFLGGVIGNPIVGNLVMDGGGGSDFLDSGFGNDVMLGGDGADTLRWLPGTLIDTFEGGGGNDTAIIVGNGRDQGDAFVLAASPTVQGRVLFQRTNLVPFFIDIGSTENVVMQTDSGNDTITIGNLSGTGVKTVTADGGTGDDIIDGSATSVNLILFGGDGYDSLTGGGGNDVITGGKGDDKIVGNKGLDVLNGGDGNDTLDDGVKDGKLDVLIGGSGADAFTSRQVSNDATPAFDEIILDFDASQGDTLTLMLVV